LASVAGATSWLLTGCSGWDPSEPFTRNAPQVDEAIAKLDAGAFKPAEEVLADYLGTGRCGDAGIGLPPKVRERSSGGFDLGLTLFHLAEKYGQRFGDEELADGGPGQIELDEKRAVEIECAQIIVQAIAHDLDQPMNLRARAFYLAGNLEFLRQAYEEAVKNYDKALQIVPGVSPEAGGDGIGRDAAWNRAIALRRIQEKDAGQPDAEPDAEPDAQPDAEPDSGDDGGDDGGQDAGEDGGGPDAGDDGGDGGKDGGGGDDGGADGGKDAGAEDSGKPPPEQAKPPPETTTPESSRMLDDLREAPTFQEEQAKKRAAQLRRRPVMEDK